MLNGRLRTSEKARTSSTPAHSRPGCRCTPTEPTSGTPAPGSPSAWARRGSTTPRSGTAAPAESAAQPWGPKWKTRCWAAALCRAVAVSAAGSSGRELAAAEAASTGRAARLPAPTGSPRRPRNRRPFLPVNVSALWMRNTSEGRLPIWPVHSDRSSVFGSTRATVMSGLVSRCLRFGSPVNGTKAPPGSRWIEIGGETGPDLWGINKPIDL